MAGGAPGPGQGGAFDLDLPGIHPEVGLPYAAGRVELYTRMLIRFREAKASTGADLRGALEAGDRDTAGRLAHTMKSTALAIGALELSGAAKALEGAILGGEDLEGPLAAFEGELQSVLEGLRAGLP